MLISAPLRLCHDCKSRFSSLQAAEANNHKGTWRWRRAANHWYHTRMSIFKYNLKQKACVPRVRLFLTQPGRFWSSYRTEHRAPDGEQIAGFPLRRNSARTHPERRERGAVDVTQGSDVRGSTDYLFINQQESLFALHMKCTHSYLPIKTILLASSEKRAFLNVIWLRCQEWCGMALKHTNAYIKSIAKT